MKNVLRLLTLLLAVTSLTFTTSCTKEQFDSEAIEANVDHPTFSELVTYRDDGSFSATLTGEEMEYILEHEFSDRSTDDPSYSFAQLLVENTPKGGKGSDIEKSTTYGTVAIAVGLGGFGSFFQFEGIGGIPATGSASSSVNACISRSTYPFVFGFGFVFSSDGVGYPVSYNDSSFDKTCLSTKWRIRAQADFNTINNLGGLAIVSCCGSIIGISADEVRR